MKRRADITAIVVLAVAVVAATALLYGCSQPPAPTTNQPTSNVTPSTPSAPSTTPTSSTTATSSTTPSATLTGVALGQGIYATGMDNSGKIAYTGGKSNITTGACVRCHGVKAKGGIGPNIQGTKLKPDFDEKTFARAVTTGVDDAGKPLKTTMPKFQTTDEDNQALWDYLNTLP